MERVRRLNLSIGDAFGIKPVLKPFYCIRGTRNHALLWTIHSHKRKIVAEQLYGFLFWQADGEKRAGRKRSNQPRALRDEIQATYERAYSRKPCRDVFT